MANSPPLVCSSFTAASWPTQRFITSYRCKEDADLSIEKIHKRVVDYLSPAEEKEFKNMSPNKIAVVILFHEVLTDYLPEIGSITYRLFGYSKLHELDHIALTGLYQGLIPRLDCQVDEFLRAYESGQLASLIELKFSALPEGSRGGYYGWFLERRDLFDGLKPPQDESASSWPDHCSHEDGDEAKGIERNRELFNGLKPSSVQMELAENESKAHKCRVCNTFASIYCGGCKSVWYCSKEHRKKDWKDHKGRCGHEFKPSLSKGGNCPICNTFASTCCGRRRKVWYCCKQHQIDDWKDHKGRCPRHGV